MTIQRAAKPIFYGWFIVGTTFFMSFLAVGSRNGFSLFFAPWKDEFGWTVSDLSLVAAIGTVTNALTTPLLGNLYDRVGGKRVITVSLIVFGLGTVALSQANSLWQLTIIYGIVISFAASGVSFVTTGPLISKWFDRKRGTAMAVQTAGAPVGGMLIFVLRESPKEMGLEPDGGADIDKSGRVRHAVVRCAPPLECTRWQDAFKSRPLWQLSLAYFVCGVTTTALGIHFVPYATDQGMSARSAALAFGLMMGLNVVGVLLAGFFSDRWGSKNLLAGVYFTRGLAYTLLIFTTGGNAIWLFTVVAGLSWIATVPLTYSLTREIYGIRAMGTLSGIVTMSHQIGGAITVWTAGWVFDTYGTYTHFWVAGAVLLGVASFLAFNIRERDLAARYQPPLPQSQQPVPVGAPAGGA